MTLFTALGRLIGGTDNKLNPGAKLHWLSDQAQLQLSEEMKGMGITARRGVADGWILVAGSGNTLACPFFCTVGEIRATAARLAGDEAIYLLRWKERDDVMVAEVHAMPGLSVAIVFEDGDCWMASSVGQRDAEDPKGFRSVGDAMEYAQSEWLRFVNILRA